MGRHNLLQKLYQKQINFESSEIMDAKRII